MTKESKDKLKGTLIVPTELAIVLVPFSLLIGWNLITGIIFWLVIIPVLTIFLPSMVSNNTSHLFESVLGLIIFYALMVFMIYDHYQSDFFQLMIFSFVVNLIVVSINISAKKSVTETQ
jgi:hypothetical protein